MFPPEGPYEDSCSVSRVNGLFIHSVSANNFMHTLQDRTCEDMFCMCIDIGCVGTGENNRAQ